MKNPNPKLVHLGKNEIAFLLLAASFYMVGAGVPYYRGDLINWTHLLIGLAITLVLTLAAILFADYFNILKRLLQIDPDREKPGGHLFLGITLLAVGVLFFVLLWQALEGPLVGLAFFTLVVCVLVYSLPPVCARESKYKMLLETFYAAIAIPSFGFAIQSSSGLAQVGWFIIPLFFILSASYLALSLAGYSEQASRSLANPMNALGWAAGMRLHNLLILIAFVLIALSGAVGVTWKLVWPRLLALPVGILAIVEMLSIAEGAPVRWKLLNSLAIALTGLSVYFLLFTLWLD